MEEKQDDGASMSHLTFVQGDPVDINQQKIVCCEFFASWCGPCRQSVPHLNELHNEYKNKGVVFVGITNESESVARTFIEQTGIEYTVAYDQLGKLHSHYKIQGIPHIVIVDRKGKVQYAGHPMQPQFTQTLDKIIAEQPAKKKYNILNMTKEQLMKLKVSELKQILKDHGKSAQGFLEKSEIVDHILLNCS